MSGAFDFTFRYSCRDAANGQNWSKLANGGINTDDAYKRYAVTFVENHDVEYRSESEPQDPINRDTVAVNAFMLAMLGDTLRLPETLERLQERHQEHDFAAQPRGHKQHQLMDQEE